ncbi:uncharacterized protein [Antedon mediterranea]|uniref:uncharacterized protein isoform X2 n=1 Tax=Antedon mediterranea TaxID=105859 RepID=UPI003AF6C28E
MTVKEIAKLTEMNDAVNLVKGYINDNRVPNTDEPKLSSFRIQLFKAMRQVHPGALRDLIAYYGLGHYNLKNIWDVVLKLEIDVILEDEPDKIERFANCLGPAVKRILLVTGNTVNNRNRCVSSSNQCEPSEGTDLSEDDFRQLIADFVQWYDERGLLTKLKVLYIYILGDVQALKRVTSTIDLLALLTEPGLLSRTNFSILYDTLKVTNQLGFESPVTKKLPLFKDIKNRDPVTFSPHTIKIFNLGKDLSDSDVKTLDGRYNFPVLKKYEDSWSLILDFEPRGLLSEDKLDEVKGVLKRPRQEKRF